MGVEIERKFLVVGGAWRQGSGVRIRQGYLCGEADATVRVRIKGDAAFLTVKGRTQGISREEYEYAIPPADAERLLALCGPRLIDKVRRVVAVDGFRWEVDEFRGRNGGLVLAELELASEDQAFTRPAWLGAEVSADPRYYNAYLSLHPYREWGPK